MHALHPNSLQPLAMMPAIEAVWQCTILLVGRLRGVISSNALCNCTNLLMYVGNYTQPCNMYSEFGNVFRLDL